MIVQSAMTVLKVVIKWGGGQFKQYWICLCLLPDGNFAAQSNSFFLYGTKSQQQPLFLLNKLLITDKLLRY